MVICLVRLKFIGRAGRDFHKQLFYCDLPLQTLDRILFPY